MASVCCDLHTKISTCGQSESWLFSQLTGTIARRREYDGNVNDNEL